MTNSEMALCIIGHEKSDTNISLLEEAKKRFDSVFFVPITSINVGLKDRFSISYRTTDLLKFRAILPRIPRSMCSYAYQLLSLFPGDTYMPVKPISFLLAEERFFLLTVLRKRGIETINLHLTASIEAAARLIEQTRFPVILRVPEKKTGVVVKNKIEAKSTIDALASLKQPVLIEDAIKDMVSVYVAEPDILAVIKKSTKEKDIAFSPGILKRVKINIEAEQLALDATKAIDAQIARVDITLSPKPRVVNIELNPDLKIVSRVTKANLPEKIISSVYENYRSHKEKPMLMKFFEDAKSVVKDVLKTKQML